MVNTVPEPKWMKKHSSAIAFLKWYFIGSAGAHTLISTSLLPNRTTRPVTASPFGGSGALFTWRMRMVSRSTYSTLVE